MHATNELEIAYIMKGFPRHSEPFITNEIYLLESMGLRIHVFALKGLSEKSTCPLVKRVKAEVTYLPESASATDSKFLVWLRVNLPRFIKSHFRLFLLCPFRYVRTLLYALYLSLKYRKTFLSRPKKVFFKDFLRSGSIAWEVLEAGRVTHLHGHFCHGSTTMTMFVSRLCNIPFSFTAHAKDIYLARLNPGDLLQIKIRTARFVVTCTSTNRIHLNTLSPDVSSIYTIHHGLDTTVFTPTKRCRDSVKPPLILAVGRFVEKKGFAYLIQACRLLQDKGFVFQCRIVGAAGDQSVILEHLVRALRLEGIVSLEGPVGHEDLRKLYEESAVFALPCQIAEDGDRDGIPNVLAEAMAMEIPVVSTEISGIPELVEHRVDGLLGPQKNASALATALEELLTKPALRGQLGKAGRRKICRMFDSRKTTVALKELFLGCLDGKGSTHRLRLFHSNDGSQRSSCSPGTRNSKVYR